MMSVGSHREPATRCSGPTWRPFDEVSSTVEMQIASRYTGNAQIRSMSRDRIASVTPPKNPAISATIVATAQHRSAEPKPISSEVRPP